jgi:hypothetical protein
MNTQFNAILLTIIVAVVGTFSTNAEAGGLGKVFGRVWFKQMAKREAARDAATLVKPLSKSRYVYRYATKGRAVKEAHGGLGKNRHTTSGVTSGRPLSAVEAQHRYGLPTKPEVRSTWYLPKGTPVRMNKVMYGKPGYGEITPSKRIEPKGLKETIQLR